jgi:MoaA/NifB/PqqE/SkfB family radical SAM enzyme
MSSNLERQPTGSVGAESLSIEVTTHCNSSCPHCFAHAAIAKHASLSPDLVREIIFEGYTAGYRHLHITGGEPLLWKGLFAVLEYGFNLGYKAVFMNTNGTLLTKDIARRLAENDGLSVSVSLEASQSFHDHLRGKGSYRQTLQGIDNALDAGIEVFIFTTAPKPLLAELPEVADKIYKRFPDIKRLILIQIIRVKDDAVDFSKELLDPGDFLQLVRTVSLLNLYGLKTDVLNEPLVNVASKLLKMPWVPKSRPLYRNGHMVIRANRDITLSHSTRYSIGRYESGMIGNVLASDTYRKAVGPDRVTCPSCKFVDLCRENGMVRPSGWFMDMQPEVPYCKRVLKRAAI